MKHYMQEHEKWLIKNNVRNVVCPFCSAGLECIERCGKCGESLNVKDLEIISFLVTAKEKIVKRKLTKPLNAKR